MDSAIATVLTMVCGSSNFHIFTDSGLSNSGSLSARDPKGVKIYFFVGLTELSSRYFFV